MNKENPLLSLGQHKTAVTAREHSCPRSTEPALAIYHNYLHQLFFSHCSSLARPLQHSRPFSIRTADHLHLHSLQMLSLNWLSSAPQSKQTQKTSMAYVHLLLHFSRGSKSNAISPVSGHILSQTPSTFSVGAQNVTGEMTARGCQEMHGHYVAKFNDFLHSHVAQPPQHLKVYIWNASWISTSHSAFSGFCTSGLFHAVQRSYSPPCFLSRPSRLQFPTVCLYLPGLHLQ